MSNSRETTRGSVPLCESCCAACRRCLLPIASPWIGKMIKALSSKHPDITFREGNGYCRDHIHPISDFGSLFRQTRLAGITTPTVPATSPRAQTLRSPPPTQKPSTIARHATPIERSYEVTQAEASEEFRKAWSAAGQYLQKIGGSSISWLRKELTPPLAEHLSFLIGNQLIFVYVAPTNDVPPPSNISIFLTVSAQATAVPCIMSMDFVGGRYTPTHNGWGLAHAITGKPVDVSSLVSDEPIEMSDWELHDFAIQVVVQDILKSGGKIMSHQPSPSIDPSIWFQDPTGPCWVVVRATRYPQRTAPIPGNIESIRAGCQRMSDRGFFASVAVSSDAQQTASPAEGIIPLYRGHGMFVRYVGLTSI